MTDSYTQIDFDDEDDDDHMSDPLVALDINSVKSQYGEKFMELRSIINRYDPMKLFRYGLPESEYDPEVKTIIVQLQSDMTLQQVHDLIDQEFTRWFDECIVKKDLALATDVYNWIKE